jgi:hypothetical protein
MTAVPHHSSGILGHCVFYIWLRCLSTHSVLLPLTVLCSGIYTHSLHLDEGEFSTAIQASIIHCQLATTAFDAVPDVSFTGYWNDPDDTAKLVDGWCTVDRQYSKNMALGYSIIGITIYRSGLYVFLGSAMRLTNSSPFLCDKNVLHQMADILGGSTRPIYGSCKSLQGPISHLMDSTR